jgi:glycosyltransferase involved in cell wall biosynthesis
MLAEPRRYARIFRGNEDFDFPGTSRIQGLIPSPADILHLHNLHGAWFDIRALPTISRRVPTMITLHDAWLLTGHCAYPLDCTRWTDGCGNCPSLDLYVPLRGDRSAENAVIKRAAVASSRLALACPSQWLHDMVTASGVTSDTVQARVVHNGIDTGVFSPGDKARARAELGLPAECNILCFAARGLEGSAFKGFDTLRAALEMLGRDRAAQGNTMLVALGSDSAETRVGGISAQFVPFVENPQRMARYYQACDIYIHPARAENFPLAVLEAMACGAPVVASAVGGIPEIVIDGDSGRLFQNDKPHALAELIAALLGDEDHREALGARGAERVASRFTLKRQVDAYLSWYRELLDDWQA